jgi:hypothetical protein
VRGRVFSFFRLARHVSSTTTFLSSHTPKTRNSRLRARAPPADAEAIDALIGGADASLPSTVTLPCAELAALTAGRDAAERAAAEAAATVARLEAALEARAAGVDALAAALEDVRTEAEALRTGLAAAEERGEDGWIERGVDGGRGVLESGSSPTFPLTHPQHTQSPTTSAGSRPCCLARRP